MVDYQHMNLHIMAEIQYFKPFFLNIFLSWQQGLPGHSPGMPWPAATYARTRTRTHTLVP